MGSVTNRAIQNEATRRYVEEIWAERLRGEGFVCPDEKLLCWYRVVNGEMIQYIIFHARTLLPSVWLEVGYGSCPIFAQPPYIRTVYNPNPPYMPGYSRDTMIRETDKDYGLSAYSDDVNVFVPKYGGRGIYMLDRMILPQLNTSKTQKDCLQSLKKAAVRTNHPTEKIYVNLVNTEFAELAIVLQDESIYRECTTTAEESLQALERLITSFPNNQEYINKQKQWANIKAALAGENLNGFIQQLELRKQKTLKWLKKMGIPV